MHLKRAISALPLVAVLSFTSSCGTLSVQEEKQFGREAQRQIRQQVTLMRDRVVVDYIRRLGDELAKHARPTPFTLKFYVVEDDDLNAFAVPGGYIYLNTGLIQSVDNAAELIGVMAHEIGHVTARHIAQIYRRDRNTRVAASIAGAVVGAATGSNAAAQAGDLASALAAHAYTASFGRDFEREADMLAVETMVKAGWDPEAMLTMFDTLRREGGGSSVPIFLRTHPPTEERQQNVKAEIAKYPDTGAMRLDDGGRLPLIQRRLELVVGTESEADPLDDELEEDDEDLLDEEDEEESESQAP